MSACHDSSTAGGIDIKSGGTITISGAVVDVKGAPIKLNS